MHKLGARIAPEGVEDQTSSNPHTLEESGRHEVEAEKQPNKKAQTKSNSSNNIKNKEQHPPCSAGTGGTP